MPTYVFTCQCGHSFEKVESMSKHKAVSRCPECACRARQDIMAEHKATGAGAGGCGKGRGVAQWPIHSVAAGVLATQVPEAMRVLGSKHEFTKDGDAIFRDPEHRRQCLKERGMVDKQSWY